MIEGKENYVGISTSAGDSMTFKILNQDTKKLIYQPLARTAKNEATKNKKLEDFLMESAPDEIVKSPEGRKPFGVSKLSELPDMDEDELKLLFLSDYKEMKDPRIFDPEDLINRAYLTSIDNNGERQRVKTVEVLNEDLDDIDKPPEKAKFIVKSEDESFDEILSHNEILDYITNQENIDDPDIFKWRFKSILAHKGPKNDMIKAIVAQIAMF